MLAQQGAFNQQGGQNGMFGGGQPQHDASQTDLNRRMQEYLDQQEQPDQMQPPQYQPMENEIQRQQAMQGS